MEIKIKESKRRKQSNIHKSGGGNDISLPTPPLSRCTTSVTITHQADASYQPTLQKYQIQFYIIQRYLFLLLKVWNKLVK